MPFPKPLSDLLEEGLAGSGLAGRLREVGIWRVWPEVVGAAIASRAQPLRIINGTLTVTVSSGPWMQELIYLKSMMIAKLNAKLGGDVVKDIILRSGRVALNREEQDEPVPEKAVLTAEQNNEIARQAARIPDLETRQAFVDLMTTAWQFGKRD